MPARRRFDRRREAGARVEDVDVTDRSSSDTTTSTTPPGALARHALSMTLYSACTSRPVIGRDGGHGGADTMRDGHARPP